MKHYFLIIGFSFLFTSCENKAKVISPTETINSGSNSIESTGIFDKSKNVSNSTQSNNPITNDMVHHIKVNEVLPTEKYVYLRVSEGDEEYWVATGKQKVDVGKHYFFKDGLLKTNFESKEYNRVFEKVYLVSKIVPENHAQETNTSAPAMTKSITKASGSISIKELVDQASILEGKEVQLTGECTKLNANIMGRNWIHLKDGSHDEYDFVVTSDQAIPEGHIVTLKGIVVLDRDFGSGYRYDLLLENASIVRE